MPRLYFASGRGHSLQLADRHPGRPLWFIKVMELGTVNPLNHPHNLEENLISVLDGLSF